MRKEFSFGIIPIRQNAGVWETLIIKHRYGHHYGFPKGHADANEKPQETARRELQEETGLVVMRFFEGITFEEEYSFALKGEKIYKRVCYFAAEVTGALKLQASEVSEAHWKTFGDAQELLSFAGARDICRQMAEALEDYNI